MRGKDQAVKNSNERTRITPAYAGKSPVWTHRTPSCQDHPRLCGEKSTRHKSSFLLKGSPPPMRGKVWKLTFENYKERITPAYAGKRCQLEMLTRL